MNDQLIKILKNLKQIEPDPGYSARSRHLLLSSKESPGRKGLFTLFSHILADFQSMRFSLVAEVLTAMLLIVFISSYSIYTAQTHREKLVVQANDINSSIQVQLDEIQYILNTKKAADMVDKAQLNQSITQAQEKLNTAKAQLEDNNLESAVDNIKSAQDIFEGVGATLVAPTSTDANASSTDGTASSTIPEDATSTLRVQGE